MDHPACPADPGLQSPSKMSCSSAASPSSTRSLSPATSSHPSSPLIELDRLTISTPEQRTGDTRRNLLYTMDNTTAPVDGSKKRRQSKLPSERGGTMGHQKRRQQQQQPTGAPVSSQAARSLASFNWHDQVLNEPTESDKPYWQRFSQKYYGPLGEFELAPRVEPPPQQQQAGTMTQKTNTSQQPLTGPGTAAGSWYAYCFDRGNGRYTRLIPADMLPPLPDIPALQHGCRGMIVLLPPPETVPVMADANRPSSLTEPAVVSTPTVTPAPPLVDKSFQMQINSILSRAPTTPPPYGQGSSSCPGDGGGGGGTHGRLESSYRAPSPPPLPPLQAPWPHYAHFPHAYPYPPPLPPLSPLPAPTFLPRPPKIYCDKWIHEGVCAFTQQGCRYKHEMPLDTETQQSLGLFHGLPAWWKRAERLEAEAEAEPVPVPVPLAPRLDRTSPPAPIRRTGDGILEALGLLPGGRPASGSGLDNNIWRGPTTVPAKTGRKRIRNRSSKGNSQHQHQTVQPLSPRSLGTGGGTAAAGQHPIMAVAPNLAPSHASPQEPWSQSPYGPIARPTPGPNPFFAPSTPSVATYNPYLTIDMRDPDVEGDAAHKG